MSIFNSNAKGCEHVRRSLDAYVSNELDEARRPKIRRHLEVCPACSQTFEDSRRIRTLVRLIVRREIAPAGLKGRIQERLRAL
jgi:anti-sigma factor (TIGR02949 family)